MQLVLVVLVLCACGGARPVAIANRGEAASTSCDVPARFDFEARRYAMVDADHADYQVWSPWRVGIQLRATDPPRGTLAMVSDDLTWTFDIAGKRTDCALDLWADSHEPIRIVLDLRTRTGRITSPDDDWRLGPPFPARR